MNKELLDWAKYAGIEKGMSWREVAAKYLGVSLEEAENIDVGDLFEEDELTITEIWRYFS